MGRELTKLPTQGPEAIVRFNKYESIRRIAVGGMAEIYLARAKGIEGFEKLVVLKRMLPQYATNTEFVNMFLDEGRIASTLRHPNIGQLIDIGTAGGRYFLVMEFLHGVDLRRLLRKLVTMKRRLPLDHAISIAIGMCAGLHHAHEHVGLDGKVMSIVHRDVSPQNAFVTYDGAVKVLDFGIAKAAHRVQETQSTSLKGKISYMSPEQCRAGAIDRRSDIFSLAIVLWEMTLMRRMHGGESEYHILLRIVSHDAPSPLSIDPEYPPELERIVMKGLKRDPAERYQTLEEMQLDLEAFAREHKMSISPVALGRFMREVFSEDVGAWQTAMNAGNVDEAARSLVSPDLANEPDAQFASDPTRASVREEEAPPPVLSRRRWWPLVIGTTLLLAAGLAAVWHWRGSSGVKAPLEIVGPAQRAEPALESPPPIHVEPMAPAQPVAPTPPSGVPVAPPSAPVEASADKQHAKKKHKAKPASDSGKAKWDPESMTLP